MSSFLLRLAFKILRCVQYANVTQDEANAALEMNDRTIKNRKIHVEISSKTGAKRQATNIINHIDRTKSPSVDRNGANSAASPSPMSPTSTTANTSQTTGDRQARTLALMNVPDTVNDARIRAITEPYGGLVKTILRPDHQGAIIEYLDASAAGKASLGLEGYEIVPNRKLQIGTVPELLKQTAEKKTDKIQVGKQAKPPTDDKPAVLNPGMPVRRPGQSGTGRRGGLGFKRGGGVSAAVGPGAGIPPKKKSEEDVSEGNANGHGIEDVDGAAEMKEEEKGKKSNDDFRAMLERKS